jgi:hypothetical protein
VSRYGRAGTSAFRQIASALLLIILINIFIIASNITMISYGIKLKLYLNIYFP